MQEPSTWTPSFTNIQKIIDFTAFAERDRAGCLGKVAVHVCQTNTKVLAVISKTIELAGYCPFYTKKRTFTESQWHSLLRDSKENILHQHCNLHSQYNPQNSPKEQDILHTTNLR